MARARFFFPALEDAGEAIIEVLQHARKHKGIQYEFGPLTAADVLENGLWLDGDIEDLAATLDNKIPAAVRHDE